jgi:hypothetical protein
MFHHDAHVRFLFHRLQHAPVASLDATPATGTVPFNNADNLVPVFLFSIRVEDDPQNGRRAYSYIYTIHFLLF